MSALFINLTSVPPTTNSAAFINVEIAGHEIEILWRNTFPLMDLKVFVESTSKTNSIDSPLKFFPIACIAASDTACCSAHIWSEAVEEKHFS